MRFRICFRMCIMMCFMMQAMNDVICKELTDTGDVW